MIGLSMGSWVDDVVDFEFFHPVARRRGSIFPVALVRDGGNEVVIENGGK